MKRERSTLQNTFEVANGRVNLMLQGDKQDNEHGFAGNILHVLGFIMASYDKGRGGGVMLRFLCGVLPGRRKRG